MDRFRAVVKPGKKVRMGEVYKPVKPRKRKIRERRK